MDKHQQNVVAEGLRESRPEAWHALFESYSEPIWRYVARRIGNQSQDVADVVQETFLAAARSASNYDPQRGTLSMWLWGIAAHQIQIHFRQAARRHKVAQASLALAGRDAGAIRSFADTRTAPESALESKELLTLIRATLAELPGDYSRLLVAKYLDGATMQEISESENTTVAAVNSKIARARQAFRHKFETMTLTETTETNVDAACKLKPS